LVALREPIPKLATARLGRGVPSRSAPQRDCLRRGCVSCGNGFPPRAIGPYGGLLSTVKPKDAWQVQGSRDPEPCILNMNGTGVFPVREQLPGRKAKWEQPSSRTSTFLTISTMRGRALRDDGHTPVTVDGNTNPRPLPGGATRHDVPTGWTSSRSTPAEQAARLADTLLRGGQDNTRQAKVVRPPTRGKAPIRTGHLPRVGGPSKMGEVLSRRPCSFDDFVSLIA